MSHTTDQFTLEANRLFNDEIRSLWESAGNVWRTACALDTFLDYFDICELDPSPYETAAIDALDPTQKGNWWDDFGWIGIAALRTAERNTFPQRQADFLKIAINAWAYMYGPGWSHGNPTVYPFMDVGLEGWQKFAKEHPSNLGAPNVWKSITQTWPDVNNQQKADRQPRYAPGGVWNAPIVDDSAPIPAPTYQHSLVYVSPIQNTVTNAVFTILSLRIYQASKIPAFSSVFAESTLDTAACLQAWKDQIAWFESWLLKTAAPDQSLLLKTGTGSLVRERAATFASLWDAAYDSNWIWTGDQGLLLGVLREGAEASYVKSAVFGLYPDIVGGVFGNGYLPRTYGGTISGSFLLPWMFLDAPNRYDTDSPAGDVVDYQTGTGVFMRYLLQAYKADPTILQPGYKDKILKSANDIVQTGFGTDPDPSGNCDSYTPNAPGTPDADQMTAYINRLAELLLAIQISD